MDRGLSQKVALPIFGVFYLICTVGVALPFSPLTYGFTCVLSLSCENRGAKQHPHRNTLYSVRVVRDPHSPPHPPSLRS